MAVAATGATSKINKKVWRPIQGLKVDYSQVFAGVIGTSSRGKHPSLVADFLQAEQAHT